MFGCYHEFHFDFESDAEEQISCWCSDSAPISLTLIITFVLLKDKSLQNSFHVAKAECFS